jgi:glycosyltransferase involved in cell wall biosynthesis
MLLVDNRWIGDHGIGRFARETLSRIPEWVPASIRLPLLHPAEPVEISYRIICSKPAIYFSPGFNPPLHSSVPFVFAIHDMIHLRIPAERSRAKEFYYRWIVRPAARRAYRIVTVSDFSKTQIVEWASLDPERVVVVGNGVSAKFQPDGPAAHLEQPFLLYVGNRKPHKNTIRLLRAFALSGLAGDVPLVMTGDPDPATAGCISQLRIESCVRFIGSVTDEQLAAYYRGALALLIPSLYEGFGLPALEAMACGCPVVASKVTALPAVCGDAAIYCAPESVEDIADQICRVVHDRDLADALRRQGPKQASRFGWDVCGAKVRSVLAGVSA